ncbi:acyl-CoA thioesterase [Alteromonas flava]|uniref:acyl-CoA thioesterase n=1 Tax=Alteromonas flava TaxID=2048003 RepID=UPI000C2876C7|nr:thioesterase family protein [Alteromonas flava]
MTSQPKAKRDAYRQFYAMESRWSDNDIYGHINNVVYYSYFDSAVNRFLIEQAGLDIHHGTTIAYVVNSQCNYFIPIAYPQTVNVGLQVSKLGKSSVTYSLAIFADDSDEAAAVGEFVHVFVDRTKGLSTPIPVTIRNALASLVVD